MLAPEHPSYGKGGAVRIKFVSQYFFPEPFSNANIANGLLGAGHSLSVMTAVPNYGAETFYPGFSNRQQRTGQWRGIPVDRVWTFPRGKGNVSLIINYLVFVLSGGRYALGVKKGQYDLVFVSLLSPVFMAIPAIILARRLDVPLVYWLQDLWPESATENLGIRSPLILKPLSALCGWIYRQADLLLVQSRAFPRYLNAHGVDPHRIRVFPNTAPDGFHPLARGEVERPTFLPRSGFNVMYAGNVGEAQGFDTVVNAAKLVARECEVNWIIVGRGRGLDNLKRQVEREGLGNRFVFPGGFPEDKMPAFFAHSDAMLVTLKNFPIFALTVPYKVHTYMSCGRPILAALNGEGARTVEEAGAGFVAPSEDPEALANIVIRMAQMDEREREEMGHSGRRFFEANFSPEIVFGNLRKWLEEVEGRGHKA